MQFTYLNSENHPRGNLMLWSMLAGGLRPELVIEERSKDAAQGRKEHLDYLGEHVPEPGPSVKELCLAQGVRYETVNNLNDDATRRLLAAYPRAYAVLGDTRILKQPIIDTVPRGIVNLHPGILPTVRGNNPYIWAVALGLPQGATAHFIDRGVDTGPILRRKTLAIEGISSFGHLVAEVNALCAQVAVSVLQDFQAGRMPQQEDQHGRGNVTFREAPKELLVYVRSLWSEADAPAANSVRMSAVVE